MKTIEFNVPFSGFYETIHSMDHEYEMLVEEHSDLENRVNWKQAYLQYSKTYLNKFNDKYDTKVKFNCIVSPKFYNYSTDRIIGSVSFAEIKRYIKRLKNQLNDPGIEYSNKYKDLYGIFICSSVFKDLNKDNITDQDVTCLLYLLTDHNYDSEVSLYYDMEAYAIILNSIQ